MPDVIDQLRRYGDAVQEAVPPARLPQPTGVRRHRALRVAAVVVAVLAIGGAAVALTRDGDEGRRVDVTDTPATRSG